MIAPLTIGLAVFYFYPVFKVIYDSFFNVGAFNVRSFAGLDNYRDMFSDSMMWSTLWNTVRYVLVIVPSTLVLSLLLAALLNTKIRGRSVFRVIYFIPAITMSTAVAMVWKWIFNGDYGILNYILNFFGIDSLRWIGDPKLTWISISIVAIWMGIGYNMVILLAGIQGISTSYYESASLDGANGIQKFFNVTLPLVTPTLFFVLITTMISTFQIFDVIYLMLNSTSLASESTWSIVVYFYKNAFEFSKKGYASAIAVLLFVIIMIVTFIQMRLQKLWVNYE